MLPLCTDISSLEMRCKLKGCADFTVEQNREGILEKQTETTMIFKRKERGLYKKEGADTPKTSVGQVVEGLYH